jgi:hypothetical protein
MKTQLTELEELLRLIDAGRGRIDSRIACETTIGSLRFPVYMLSLGSRDPGAPAIGFFGGVHGLERIGTHVLLAFLTGLLKRMDRDAAVSALLSEARLVFMPLVNPTGMWAATRANANGVDLMRNAPVQSRERVAFLVGGHRWSRMLPWYRGAEGSPMEVESQALCSVVRDELLSRPFSIALDCHSGFGLRDRIWFPYAHTREPFPHVAEIYALMGLFSAAHPEHSYLFEPQSRRYRTHGDLWDYLSAEAAERGAVFVPLTLEMGSWRWIRKSPRQVLSRLGIFNPMPEDRRQRVRRNHLAWLYFLCEAVRRHREWLPVGEERARHQQSALAYWFA